VQYTVLNSTLASLWVMDSTIAYVGGYDFVSNINQLFKTTNGGNNWVNKNPPSVPTDIFFVNKDSGWYCDDFIGADVRTTTDGGQTWQLRISGISAATQRVFFLNYNTGWCVANFWSYKTTNAGLNWIQTGSFSEQIKSVYFLDENTGWLGATNDKIFFTSNSGTNWQQQITPPFAGTTTDIYFLNQFTGRAGNSSITIFTTTDGGNNWGYQFDTSQSYRITIIDGLKGWTGQFDISHTSNGGGPIFYTGFVSNGNNVPSSYKLYQNYPNPFNPYTTIKLDTYRGGPVSLHIYDILGKEVYSIANQNLTAGTYEFNWDARDYSSGVYVCRVIADGFTDSIKMILSK
jgi:photosystem II stability/assembly factor-like uncharacterized protein